MSWSVGIVTRPGCASRRTTCSQVYPLLEEAQRIVVASPIYFYGVTAQLKLLVDRAQALYMKREIARKEGTGSRADADPQRFSPARGATRGKRLFECSILTMKYFFDALGVPYDGELSFKEVEERGAILQHPQAMEECRRAGRNFVLGT